MTDQPDMPPTFICAMSDQEPPELTAEEARTLADDLGRDLYLAQDALAFVEECCVIADRDQRTITTADVRQWLKGAQCGRQLAATAPAATEATERTPCPACRRADQAGLAPDEQHAECITQEQPK